MHWTRVDQAWARKGACQPGQPLEAGITYTIENWVVPGEDPLPVRVCTRTGFPLSSYCSSRHLDAKSITLHETAGYGTLSVLMGGSDPAHPTPVSVHFLTGRDGNVYQFCPIDRVAWHANAWSLNSIGIEVDNIASLYEHNGDGKLYSAYGTSDLYCAKSDAGVFVEKTFQGIKYWASWTSAQYDVTARLIKAICHKQQIPRYIQDEQNRFQPLTRFPAAQLARFRGVMTHYQVNPANRVDIGPYIDWARLIHSAGLIQGDCFNTPDYSDELTAPGAGTASAPASVLGADEPAAGTGAAADGSGAAEPADAGPVATPDAAVAPVASGNDTSADAAPSADAAAGDGGGTSSGEAASAPVPETTTTAAPTIAAEATPQATTTAAPPVTTTEAPAITTTQAVQTKVTSSNIRVAGKHFVDWFNEDLRPKYPGNHPTILLWKKPAPMFPTKLNKANFVTVFDNVHYLWADELTIPEFFGFFGIFYNETGGTMQPIAELGGLKWMFEATPGGKPSYNIAPNRLAGDQLKAKGVISSDADVALWNGKTYPATVSASLQAALKECDFYKYRGHGFIQTTWRNNFHRDVDPALKAAGYSKTCDDMTTEELEAAIKTDPKVSLPMVKSFYKTIASKFAKVNQDPPVWADTGRAVSGQKPYGDLFQWRCETIFAAMKKAGFELK